MRESLAILKDMPEAEQRTQALAHLEAQLQVVLKPQVAAAIHKEALGELQVGNPPTHLPNSQ